MPKTSRGLDYALTDLRAPWCATSTPVVFNHGIGTDKNIWSDWLPAIATRHPVARFDMRGFGASAVPPEGHNWSFDEMIDDLFEVAATMGPGPYHLVGESIGGTIVLAAALKHPDRVRSVTMSNAAHKGQGLGQIHLWTQQFRDEGLAGWAERMMGHRFRPGAVDASRRDWFARQQAKGPASAVLALGALLAGADLSPSLQGFATPLLILHPDSSPFIPVTLIADLKARVPEARLHVFPATKHGLPFSHAHLCVAELARFLEDIEAGP